MPVFQRIAVVGLGLLGGSVALAARQRGVAGATLGSTRSQEGRDLALELGAVDAMLPLADVARDADLVVLATPVYAMPEILRRLAPTLADGAIVTDVGSVKAPLAETLPGLLPPGRLYVGSHPMAGGQHSGMAHADADLFEDAACIVTRHGEPEAEARLCDFWAGLGARVVRRTTERHDQEVGWVSHLPHLLAFAYARAYGDAPADAADVVGPAFRDFTRIARSDAELWGDILTTNRKALAGPLERVLQSLGDLSRTLQTGDADAMEQWLQAAGRALAGNEPESRAADDRAAPGSEPETRKRRSRIDT